MWHRRHEQCVSCGMTDVPHMAKGKCGRCYLADYRSRHGKRIAKSKRAWYAKNIRHVRIRQKLAREERHYSGRRDAVLKRDGYRCTKCGKGTDLVVHHKDGSGRGSSTHNNALSNLVSLCRACHQREHRLLDRWARDFERCQECGTTERRHNAKGLCWKCYAELKRAGGRALEI